MIFILYLIYFLINILFFLLLFSSLPLSFSSDFNFNKTLIFIVDEEQGEVIAKNYLNEVKNINLNEYSKILNLNLDILLMSIMKNHLDMIIKENNLDIVYNLNSIYKKQNKIFNVSHLKQQQNTSKDIDIIIYCSFNTDLKTAFYNKELFNFIVDFFYKNFKIKSLYVLDNYLNCEHVLFSLQVSMLIIFIIITILSFFIGTLIGRRECLNNFFKNDNKSRIFNNLFLNLFLIHLVLNGSFFYVVRIFDFDFILCMLVYSLFNISNVIFGKIICSNKI